MIKIACPLLILGLLTACAVGPDYTTPEISVPTEFSGGGPAGATQEVVHDRWWSSFGDPTLEELITEGIRSNKDLQGAIARVNQSRALRRQAMLDLFPTITSEGTYNRTRFPTSTFAGGALGGGQSHISNEFYSADFDAVWELDLFGRVRRGYEAADAQTEASIATVQDALRVLIGEIARNYFQLRGEQTQILVAQENARTQENVVKIARSLYAGGQTTEFDLVRGRAQLAATRATIPPLEAGVKGSIYRLAVLTGKQPIDLIPTLSQVKPLPVYSGPITLGTPSQLLQRRPDIRAAERRLASATANIGVAEGDLFPKLTFIGTISVQAPKFSELSSGDSDAYALAPSITWPAFNIGRVLAGIDQADAAAKEALASYEQSVLLALEDTENALAQFAATRLRRDLLRESVEDSSKAVQIARTQYENGLIDLLPVLDAQRALLAAQLQYTESETNLSNALVALFKALGGGWDDAVVRVGDDIPEVVQVGAAAEGSSLGSSR